MSQVVALKDKAFTNPDLAVIHAPLAALPVAFPRERFMQVCCQGARVLISTP